MTRIGNVWNSRGIGNETEADRKTIGKKLKVDREKADTRVKNHW